MFVQSVNSCYRVLNLAVSWSMAGLACRALHRYAHLVVINDEAEQEAVAGILSTYGECLYLHVFIELHSELLKL